jgi:hypothetical protein
MPCVEVDWWRWGTHFVDVGISADMADSVSDSPAATSSGEYNLHCEYASEKTIVADEQVHCPHPHEYVSSFPRPLFSAACRLGRRPLLPLLPLACSESQPFWTGSRQ